MSDEGGSVYIASYTTACPLTTWLNKLEHLLFHLLWKGPVSFVWTTEWTEWTTEHAVSNNTQT